MDEEHWYDSLLRIPQDALSMLQQFLADQEERYDRYMQGDDAAFYDYLTFGLISAIRNSTANRAKAMLEEPSFYNVGNWLTIGLFDVAKETFNPDDPLSFEHWLSSLTLTSILYGAYRVGETAIELRRPTGVVMGNAGTTIESNKLNHLFGKPEHNFDDFLQSFDGNQAQAYIAIESTAQNYVTANGITGVISAANEITVNVAGFNVTTRGIVVDGVFKMGTAFIKP